MIIKRYVLALGLPALVACQNPVRQGSTADHPAVQPPASTSSPVQDKPTEAKPQGLWIQTNLLEQYRKTGKVLKCGDRERLPKTIAIDDAGDIKALVFVVEKDALIFKVNSLLGKLTPDFKILNNETFPAARLAENQLELVKANGQVEFQAHYTRTTTSEATQVHVQQLMCIGQVAADASHRLVPETPIDLENRAVMAKNEIAIASLERGEKSIKEIVATLFASTLPASLALKTQYKIEQHAHTLPTEVNTLKSMYGDAMIERVHQMRENGTSEINKVQKKLEVQVRIAQLNGRLVWLRTKQVGYALAALAGYGYALSESVQYSNQQTLLKNEKMRELLSMPDDEFRTYISTHPEVAHRIIQYAP